MPSRRGRQLSKAAPAPDGPLITNLDQHSLEIIFRNLTSKDQRGFALAHPSFLKTYRNLVAKAETSRSFSRLEEISQTLAKLPNLNSVSLSLFIKNGAPSLSDLTGPSSIREMNLRFSHELPHRRSFQALTSNFANLKSLLLKNYCLEMYKGSGKVAKCINSDGSLKQLSALRNLEELTLTNLASDDGIQHLTSLTKLTVSFPTLKVDYPDSLYCLGCASIHVDDATDLEYYQNSIPWGSGTVLGKNIGTLPKLKEFTIDFDTTEQSLGYSAVLNRLLLREPSRRFGSGGRRNGPAPVYLNDYNNIHAVPNTPLYFQKLETITFLNCGGPEHFLYSHTMQRRIRYPSEGLACNDLWHTCVIWECIKHFPNLQKWRLHAFDGGLEEGVDSLDVNWPCACGCGVIIGQVREERLPCGCGGATFVELDRPEALSPQTE